MITAPRLRSALAVILAGALAGCATVSEREREAQIPPATLAAYVADKPEPIREHYAMVLVQGPRNEILNHMRSGLAAYALGALPAATDSFERALQGIEAVYANNPNAAKAREMFTRESYKDFKGEPYERAMAYYYRGLLYMREGDYQNARASFKGGILQDAFAEEEQNRSDFALLIFLEGWASQCAGDPGLARDSFAEVANLKAELTPPAPEHNVLVLVETGPAPVKFADGPKRQLLRYRRGAGPEEARAEVQVDGAAPAPAYPVEDVFFQASTRGGRPVDYILEGKVRFKEGVQTTGTVLKTVGIATLAAGAATRNEYAAMAGGVVTILGFVADGVASAVKPEADARYWDNLPERVHVLTATLPPGPHEIRARVLDAAGDPVAGAPAPAEVQFAGRCGLAWLRSAPAVPAAVRAPNTVTRPQ